MLIKTLHSLQVCKRNPKIWTDIKENDGCESDGVRTIFQFWESLNFGRIAHPHWNKVLRDFVEEHAKRTESALASQTLNHWDRAVQHFWQVVPVEIVPLLDIPLSLNENLSETA